MNKLTMGDRIKETRKSRNFTQEQLAEKLNISVEYVSQIERGLKLPSMQLFIELLEVLDVSADYLLRDVVPTHNLYADKQINQKLENLSPRKRIALQAIIDAYLAYLD